MATEPKQIVHLAMDCGKALGLAEWFESQHLAFLLSGLFMRYLRPVVSISVLAVNNRGHQFFPPCTAAIEFVGDHLSRWLALALQHLAKKPVNSTFITLLLNKEFELVIVLIDSAPMMVTKILSMNHVSPHRPSHLRSLPAYPGLRLRYHCRIASYETIIPRSAKKSSMSWKLSVNQC